MVENPDGSQSLMQLVPVGATGVSNTGGLGGQPGHAMPNHDPSDPTLLYMGIATQDLLDKMPPGISKECLEQMPLSRVHDLINLNKIMDSKARSASLIKQATELRSIPEHKDDRMKVLHPARMFPKPLAPPIEYWRDVPVKIEPVLPSIQLAHMGLEFGVSTRTLAMCHNRATPVEIKYFLRINKGVTSLPVRTKQIHSSITGQPIGTESDLPWKNATKMRQIMEGLLAYEAIYDSLHPYDYGPKNIVRAMFNWHFLAFRPDQLSAAREIINSIMARNAELADELRPPLSMEQLDEYIKKCLISIGGRYQIPESFNSNDLFTTSFYGGSTSGNGGGNGRDGGVGQGGSGRGRGGGYSGTGSGGYGRDRTPAPSPNKSRKSYATIYHNNKEVCGMFNTRNGCPRAKHPAKECTLTTKADGKSRQLIHVCSKPVNGGVCGNASHNYFGH